MRQNAIHEPQHTMQTTHTSNVFRKSRHGEEMVDSYKISVLKDGRACLIDV
jgi:hypothetical protein